MLFKRTFLLIIAFLAAGSLAACLGAAPGSMAYEDREIPSTRVEEPANRLVTADGAALPQSIPAGAAQELPGIPMGRPTFRVTDPQTVRLASGRVQLIEFFAHWCSVCKAMAPTVHGLEDLYGDQIDFVYLDREDPATEPLRNQLGYVYQPHFFLLGPDGSLLGQWRGYVEGAILQQALVEAIE